MITPIAIAKVGTTRATRALTRLSERLTSLEQFDSAAYRARCKSLFGKILSPEQVVNRILSDTREKGDAALTYYSKRLDGVALTPSALRISNAMRRAAYRRAAPALRATLELAAARIADYQQRLMPADVISRPAKCGPLGARMGMVWSPLQRVGLYVPGGTAAYPSSVLMNAVPAQVAGVKELVVTTPPDRNGAISDGVLCACEILGIKEIYRLGGAQAIGAMAFGTRSIARVNKIVGPGNLFVMLAKRAVFGHVDIDMLAGPSEALIIADASANAEYIAADLLAQAEHDPLAACILLTPDARLAENVARELTRQLTDLPRQQIAATALRDWGLIAIAENLAQAVNLANRLAPEHLSIMTRNPRSLARKLTTAGAIFLGAHATESLGDYVAGPSHTLPTGATAQAFSGLSVFSFLRRTSIIETNAQGLEALAEPIMILAAAEGLEAHRRAVAVRMKR